jgi:hypothetical protein
MFIGFLCGYMFAEPNRFEVETELPGHGFYDRRGGSLGMLSVNPGIQSTHLDSPSLRHGLNHHAPIQ